MTATPCYRRMRLCVHAANSTALRNTRLTHTSAGSDNRHLRHLDQGGKVHHKAHSPNDHCGLLPEPIHDDRGSESRQRSHTIHGAKANVTKVAVEKACDIVLLRSRQTVGGGEQSTQRWCNLRMPFTKLHTWSVLYAKNTSANEQLRTAKFAPANDNRTHGGSRRHL